MTGPDSPAAPPRPARRRRARRRTRRRLRSENLRMLLSFLGAVLAGGLAALPLLDLLDPDLPPDERLAPLLVVIIVTTSVYSLLFAVLTYAALRGRPRRELLATARLTRVRRGVPEYRWLVGRAGAWSEVLQLLLVAALAAVLLATQPERLSLTALLLLTIGALASAWIAAVVTFALEYAAEDAHGEAFSLAGTPVPERVLADYVYGAVLVQTSAGPSDLGPRTAAARSLVRGHVILAHVTSTIIITLGVSAVLTVVT